MTAPQIVPIQVPNTTGAVRSFQHARLEIAGLEFTGGFKSIKRSRKREREMPYSNSPDPIGKTLGENKYQASAVLYYDWWMNLLQTVQQNLGPGYGDFPFTIYMSYQGQDAGYPGGLVTYVDTILNCTFDTTEADDAAGNQALVREVEFNPTKILFGGFDDLAVPFVAPPP
jgi:hypothetical protein